MARSIAMIMSMNWCLSYAIVQQVICLHVKMDLNALKGDTFVLVLLNVMMVLMRHQMNIASSVLMEASQWKGRSFVMVVLTVMMTPMNPAPSVHHPVQLISLLVLTDQNASLSLGDVMTMMIVMMALMNLAPSAVLLK